MIAQPSPRLAGALRALWRDCDGSAILEFAFVGPMFIALLMGILSIGLTYLTQGGLETAAETAARLVMTGQAQTIKVTGNSTAGMTAANFKTAICSGLTGTNAAGNILTSPIVAGQPNSSFVVLIPSTMLPSGSTLIPVNPNGTTGICSNFSASSASLTQIGQAGGYLFVGTIIYQYTPAISLGAKSTTTMQDAIYMSPRLN